MRSIRSQIFISLILVLVVQFAFLSFTTQRQLSTLPEQIHDQYQEIVIAYASEVSRELHGLMDQSKLITRMPFVREMNHESIRAYLTNIIDTSKYINLTISDIDGNAWRSVGMEIDISAQEQFRHIIIEGNNSIVSQPFYSPFTAVETDLPIITVSHKVTGYNEETVGLANIVVDLKFLQNTIRSIANGVSEQAMIIDNSGRILAHTNSTIEIFTPLSALTEFSSKKDFPDWTQINNTGSFSNEQLVTIYQPIDFSPNWTFLVTYNEKDIYAEVAAVNSSLLKLLLFSLIIVAIPVIIYTNYTLKPLNELRSIFDDASRGNLYVSAKENYPNEFQSLAISFNAMLRRIKSLLYKDQITGLPNYNGGLVSLPKKLDVLQDKLGRTAIAIISIDDFKRINSISGYATGNQYLRSFANHLRTFLTEVEGVARYFGDEFVVLLYADNEKSMAKRLEKLLEISTQAISTNEFEFNLTVSIGVSFFSKDSAYTEQTQVINKQADIAKLHAKQLGGGALIAYTESLDAEIKERQRIESALKHALENDELYLVYQPIVELCSRKVVAAEALLRWNNQHFQHVSPQKIIDIAEKNGLIFSIGDWVMRQAVSATKEWQKQGYDPFIISVNISALQLEDVRFIQKVKAVLADYQLDAKWLELEITETNAMYNIDKAMLTLAELSSVGVKVAIDDFGTGYSSLSYLTKLSVDTLKIDRSLINQIEDSKHGLTIIDAIFSMAKLLNVQIVAEGVENESQIEYLGIHGCNNIQGYLISKPVPADEFSNHLTKTGA